MKILQFPLSATKGGITQYVLNVWRNIDKDTFHFDFVTFSKKLDFAHEIEEQGSTVYYMSKYPEEDEKLFTKEFMNVLTKGYDAIEIHTSYWTNTIVEKLAKRANISRIIVHAHSTGIRIKKGMTKHDISKLNLIHEEIRNSLDKSLITDYWACSKAAAEWLYGTRIAKEDVCILHNTIDTKHFQYDSIMREKMREMLKVQDEFVLGMVGRLEVVKNFEFAIRFFDLLHKKYPKTILVIVGDGTMRSTLEKKCEDLKLGENVKFIGLIDNVTDYLQAMDLYLLPSYFEGFPISLLEAQCSGLACIASEATPSEAIVTNIASRLPLKELDWIKKSERYIVGYERKDQSEDMKRNGFDIKDLISVLERRYIG